MREAVWANAAHQGRGLYQHKGRKKSRTQVMRRKPHGLGLGGGGGEASPPDGKGRRGERAESDLAGLSEAHTSLTPQSQCP